MVSAMGVPGFWIPTADHLGLLANIPKMKSDVLREKEQAHPGASTR